MPCGNKFRKFNDLNENLLFVLNVLPVQLHDPKSQNNSIHAS